MALDSNELIERVNAHSWGADVMDRANVRDMIKQMRMIEPDELGVEFCRTIKPTVDIHGSTMKDGERGGAQPAPEAKGECEIASTFRFSGVIGQGGMGFVSREVQLELGGESR
jgi:hypothetical protein